MDMAFDELFDKAKDTADKAKEKAAEVFDAGADSVILAKDATVDIIEAGRDKLQEGMAMVIEETNKIITILQSSGFQIIDINVTVSIPPRAKLIIEDMGDGKNKLSQLLESKGQTLSKTQKTMIKALLKTYDLSSITERYGYQFGRFVLSVSIPPQVTIHLLAKK
jgi:hypothetical protein